MIQDVTFEKTVYQPAPGRFEAGTGNIADAVGLGAALDYVERIGIDNVSRYEHDLLVYATHGLTSIPGLRLIGTAREKAGVLSFVLDGFRSEDVGAALNREGIAVRAGHHCASRSCDASGSRPRSGRRWRSTTPARKSTRWSPPFAESRRDISRIDQGFGNAPGEALPKDTNWR
jgi:selenocysteine lyase/cysteine desulfurase